jgi:transcription antitermination factor NusG
MALAESDIATKALHGAQDQSGPTARRWRFDPVEWELGRKDPSTSRWIVLHTRSRQEKAVSELLEANGVETFLPLVNKVRFYGHRKRSVELPLFPSYLFLWGPLEAIYPAIASKRAVGAVRTENQDALDRELLNLRIALESGAGLDPYPFLERGRPVRVTAGPFKGIEGVVEDRRSIDRLVLQIHTLGRATALEIDPSILEPLD